MRLKDLSLTASNTERSATYVKISFKKDANELQEYLQFRRRGSRVESVKGKGSKYKRSREKDKMRKEIE